MHSKSTTLIPNVPHRIHEIPAGILQTDKTTELFACMDTKRVFGVSEGRTIPFSEICPAKRAQLFEKLLQDDIAMDDLKHLSQEEAIEQYAFCNYGDLDSNADFCEEGNLKSPDNFQCSGNCRCIHWRTKNIMLNGKYLTAKKIRIINLLATDLPDKQIADQLEISQSTLDTHKTQLFEMAGVFSTKGLIMECVQQKILQ